MIDGPADWGRSLYERVLDGLGVGSRSRLLDVGCGTGRVCRLAADRGAGVTGVDADPDRLASARRLVPDGVFLCAELPALPLPDGSAAAVSCVQVLMHVANPVAALRELARVAAPGGRLALTVWGPPEECALGAFGEALAPVLGPPPWLRRDPAAGPGPPPLWAPGRLARLAGASGLVVDAEETVRCPFDYPSERELLAGLYAAELGQAAVARAGRRRVRTLVRERLAKHRLADGGYRLCNTFRLVVAGR